MPRPNERYLGTTQVARMFRVHVNTVAAWVDAGRFPGSFRLPFSGHRRIPLSEVQRLLRERTYERDPDQEPGPRPGKSPPEV